MDGIELIKEKVHFLEMKGKRTPIWTMLVRLYEENQVNSRLASLCMRQMVMYLDELEGDPRWGKRERENEYEDYYAFLQKILAGYDTLYRDDLEFQWSLCYYLKFISTWHFILGDTIQYQNVNPIRKKIISRFLNNFPPLKLFEYIDQIQSDEQHFQLALDMCEIQELQREIDELNLQDNSADQDLKVMLVDAMARFQESIRNGSPC